MNILKNSSIIRLCLVVGVLSAMFFAPAFALADENDKEPESINAADDINVKLQIPLPFVRTGPTAENSECEAGKVCNLTEYIKGVYRLLIGLGALFAVVMMIIAGYQWMFSGGSADKTGAAKKRIFNAWIGLILALLSYVILNAITPRLVALRLPKVDPVPTFEFDPDNSCQTVFSKNETGVFNNKMFNEFKKIIFKHRDPNTNKLTSDEIVIDRAQCGIEYEAYGNVVSDKTIIAQCNGAFCDTSMICVSGRCMDAVIYGAITWPFYRNTYVDQIDLVAVCNDKTKAGTEIQSKDVNGARVFRMPRKLKAGEVAHVKRKKKSTESSSRAVNYYIQEAINACKSIDKFKGFVLRVEINDDEGAWHNILPTIDDDFALGKNPGTRRCNPTPFFKEMPSGNNKLDFDDIDFTDYASDNLFSVDDIDNGVQCEIDIDESRWPLI